METPINLLPTFLELAESLNISHTAKKLKISQPAVSRQLQALEQNLGVSLFLRQSRGLTLTIAGNQLKSQLQEPMDIMYNCLNMLRSNTTVIAGNIVMGSLTEVGKRQLMPLLIAFAEIHKGITLDIRLMSGRLIPQAVKEGQLGLGVIAGKPKDSSLKVHHLFYERIVALTSSKNRVNLDIDKAPQFAANSSQDPLLLSFLRKHFQKKLLPSPKIMISVNSHRSMLEALEGTSLYAVMPIQSAEEHINKGTLRLASRYELKNEVYLIHRKGDFLERRYEELVEFLLQKTKNLRI